MPVVGEGSFQIRSTGPPNFGSKVNKLFSNFDFLLIDGNDLWWRREEVRQQLELNFCKKQNAMSIAQVCEVKVEVDAEV